MNPPMDSTTYFTLTLLKVPALQEDQLTGFLFENGAAGIQENLKFSQQDRHYLPEVLEEDEKDLVVYFEVCPVPEFLDRLVSDYPEIEIQLNEAPLKDWLAEWKAQWKPFCLVDNIWVVPEWEKEHFNDTNKQVLFIEPGMAFGTGTHATTQIASSLLLQITRTESVKSMVDVGTGSGILALLGHLLKIKNVAGYDNDLESRRVFLENLEKNQATQIKWEENWVQSLKNQMDLCVANIIDGVLIDLKPQFRELGCRYYIFTGILLEREDRFLSEMTEGWSLRILKRLVKDEWVGFLVENSR